MIPAQSVTLSCSARSRPWLQSLALPFETLAALALKILGHLANYLGAVNVSRKLIFEAAKLENRCATLFVGLLTFGRKFLVYSDNHGRTLPEDLRAYQEKGYCRGAVYWMALRMLRSGESPIAIAREFEKSMPDAAVQIHEMAELPPNLGEERLSAQVATDDWKRIDTLPEEGIYSVRIGSWNREMQAIKSHRFLVVRGPVSYLFDPALGLSEFQEPDWSPQLKRSADMIDSQARVFFTVESFRHI